MISQKHFYYPMQDLIEGVPAVTKGWVELENSVILERRYGPPGMQLYARNGRMYVTANHDVYKNNEVINAHIPRLIT